MTSRSPTSRWRSSGARRSALAEHEMPGLMSIAARVPGHATARGRPDHRLAAHDDPNSRADRDARGARRRGPLGFVQHLLDPGSRGGGNRRGAKRYARRSAGRTGLRLEGRDARGVLVVHRAGAALARRRRPEHDPRRRRRRDAARAQGRRVRARRAPFPTPDGADNEEFSAILLALLRALARPRSRSAGRTSPPGSSG